MNFSDQTDEVSAQLEADEILSLVRALPRVLIDLVGNANLVVRYGAGCQIHGDLWLVPMRVNTSWLADFLERAIDQHIFLPCDAEMRIDLESGDLKVAFCNEAHLHVGGSSESLRSAFLSSEPFSTVRMVGVSDGLG